MMSSHERLLYYVLVEGEKWGDGGGGLTAR